MAWSPQLIDLTRPMALGAPDRAVGRRVRFAAFPVAGAGGSSGHPPPATGAGGGLVRLNGRQPLMEDR